MQKARSASITSEKRRRVRADPEEALARREKPILIDEWQYYPDILWTVKQAVDEGAEPGSFIEGYSVGFSGLF